MSIGGSLIHMGRKRKFKATAGAGVLWKRDWSV